jgi:RNA polymerase sigma-70 factor (ECF subfamily)
VTSERAQSAAAPEFDSIYLAEYGRVLRHLIYLTGDRAAAEDLAQETFGRLLERPPTELRNARAWLLTVASNLAYNHFRGETRRREREGRVADATPADLDAVLDVRRSLHALAPRDRVVLLLRHGGFSYAEISETTGLAPGSVGTTLARAQARFRELYEGPQAAAAKEDDPDVL